MHRKFMLALAWSAISLGCGDGSSEEKEVDCTDGIDDDGDGLVDCDDPDCADLSICGGGDADTDTDTDTDSDSDTDLVPEDLDNAPASFFGDDDGDRLGFAIAGGQDLNGDGEPDIVVGAYNRDTDCVGVGESVDSGAVYVFYGPHSGGYDAGDYDARFCGDGTNQETGRGLAVIPDITGDGNAELLIGAPGKRSGTVFMWSGGVEGDFLADTAVAELRGDNTQHHFGHNISAGKTASDSTMVLVTADAWSTSEAAPNKGAVYIYRSDGTGLSQSPHASVYGANTGDSSGRDATFLDLDNDGLDELIVGAFSLDTGAGTSLKIDAGAFYIVDSADIDGTVALGSLGVRIDGSEAKDQLGERVSRAGDVNDDGYQDLLVTAIGASTEAGAVWIVFGKSTVYSPGSIETVADGRLTGSTPFERVGSDLAYVGDQDGDGIDDLAIGAMGRSESIDDRGAVYLVPGGNYLDGLSVEMIKVGVRAWYGANLRDQAGHRVSGLGDMDDDGVDDLIIGAWSYNDSAGAAYLVYGGF